MTAAGLGDAFGWIEAGSRNVAGRRTGTHGTTSLTPDDAEAIRREIRSVRLVSENVDGHVQVIAGDRNRARHDRVDAILVPWITAQRKIRLSLSGRAGTSARPPSPRRRSGAPLPRAPTAPCPAGSR